MYIRVLALVKTYSKKGCMTLPEYDDAQRDEPRHPTKLNFGAYFVGTNASEKVETTAKIAATKTFILMKAI